MNKEMSPEVLDNPIILNLHLFFWDSYIAICNVRPPIAAEGSVCGCGYPPSFARSQNIGNGILGFIKIKEIMRTVNTTSYISA